MKNLVIIVIASISFIGCSSQKQDTTVIKVSEAPGSNTKYMPKASIYRMSGDYAENVPINVNDRGEVMSFPDPRDLTTAMKPKPLANGYWLDSRGVTIRSVFTRYTYDQYMSLPSVPSLSDLKAAIIPGAHVIEVVELPMRRSEALADTAAVNALIRQGLPGCTSTQQTPTLNL